MVRLRQSFPEIHRSITRLEGNLGLSQEENEKLVKGVEEFLKGEV
jgi:environmental stress-induced protein Ves